MSTHLTHAYLAIALFALAAATEVLLRFGLVLGCLVPAQMTVSATLALLSFPTFWNNGMAQQRLGRLSCPSAHWPPGSLAWGGFGL